MINIIKKAKIQKKRNKISIRRNNTKKRNQTFLMKKVKYNKDHKQLNLLYMKGHIEKIK